jgi:hypothetical protein
MLLHLARLVSASLYGSEPEVGSVFDWVGFAACFPVVHGSQRSCIKGANKHLRCLRLLPLVGFALQSTAALTHTQHVCLCPLVPGLGSFGCAKMCIMWVGHGQGVACYATNLAYGLSSSIRCVHWVSGRASGARAAGVARVRPCQSPGRASGLVTRESQRCV